MSFIKGIAFSFSFIQAITDSKKIEKARSFWHKNSNRREFNKSKETHRYILKKIKILINSNVAVISH